MTTRPVPRLDTTITALSCVHCTCHNRLARMGCGHPNFIGNLDAQPSVRNTVWFLYLGRSDDKGGMVDLFPLPE